MRPTLLEAVPECAREAALNTRQVSAAEVLCATMAEAGLGMLRGREQTLRAVNRKPGQR